MFLIYHWYQTQSWSILYTDELISALCFRISNTKKWTSNGGGRCCISQDGQPQITCHHPPGDDKLINFFDILDNMGPEQRTGLLSFVTTDPLFLWPITPPQMDHTNYLSPTNYSGPMRLQPLSATPPVFHKRRGKNCEDQRHWKWRPSTHPPSKLHSHTHRLSKRKPLMDSTNTRQDIPGTIYVYAVRFSPHTQSS